MTKVILTRDYRPLFPRLPERTRMLIEVVLSMLTTVSHLKHQHHWQTDYFRARLAFMIAAFNLLVQWHSLQPDVHGMIHLSIAEFSL